MKVRQKETMPRFSGVAATDFIQRKKEYSQRYFEYNSAGSWLLQARQPQEKKTKSDKGEEKFLWVAGGEAPRAGRK